MSLLEAWVREFIIVVRCNGPKSRKGANRVDLDGVSLRVKLR